MRGFLEHLAVGEPPAADWQVDQARQALELFARGIENWHWEVSDFGRLAPRFRPRPGEEEEVREARERARSMERGAKAESGEEAQSAEIAETDVKAPDRVAAAEGLLGKMRRELRSRHYSYRTEETYLQWVRRFLEFHPRMAPERLHAGEIKAFLDHLWLERNVAASTQNQAVSSILFFSSVCWSGRRETSGRPSEHGADGNSRL